MAFDPKEYIQKNKSKKIFNVSEYIGENKERTSVEKRSGRTFKLWNERIKLFR